MLIVQERVDIEVIRRHYQLLDITFSKSDTTDDQIFCLILLLTISQLSYSKSSLLNSWKMVVGLLISYVELQIEIQLDYIKPEDRIAAFDNDGTLWAENPAIFRLISIYTLKERMKITPFRKK